MWVYSVFKTPFLHIVQRGKSAEISFQKTTKLKEAKLKEGG